MGNWARSRIRIKLFLSFLQFLLMDTPSQVWFFILQYLDSLARRNLNLGECLNFLFQLSFSELGKVSKKITEIKIKS